MNSFPLEKVVRSSVFLFGVLIQRKQDKQVGKMKQKWPNALLCDHIKHFFADPLID